MFRQPCAERSTTDIQNYDLNPLSEGYILIQYISARPYSSNILQEFQPNMVLLFIIQVLISLIVHKSQPQASRTMHSLQFKKPRFYNRCGFTFCYLHDY